MTFPAVRKSYKYVQIFFNDWKVWQFKLRMQSLGNFYLANKPYIVLV